MSNSQQRLESGRARVTQRDRPQQTPLRPRQFFGKARIATAPVDEQLLTLEQVRERLNLRSIWAVYRRIQQHGLPTRRVGGVYRVSPSELDAWTKAGR